MRIRPERDTLALRSVGAGKVDQLVRGGTVAPAGPAPQRGTLADRKPPALAFMACCTARFEGGGV